MVVILALQGTGNCHAAELLVRDITLISPERDRPLEHANVLVRDGRIAAISQQALPAATTATMIDGRGRYLIPGLIDSHVHLNQATGLKARYTRDYPRLFADFQRQQPRSYLYFGYTSLIENNGDDAASATFERQPQRPRRWHCGEALVISDDFMATDFPSPEAFLQAYPNFLYDHYRSPALPAGVDRARHTPAATVARIAASGARCVKMYYEEAHWWPDGARPAFKLPSLPILRDVVKAAHQHGLTVLLHGTTPAAHRIGLEAGVDVMAHGLWDWDGALFGQETVPATAWNVATAVAKSKMSIQPTWMAAAGMTSMFDPDGLDDARLGHVLPPGFLTYLRTSGQQARTDYVRRFQPALEQAFARGAAATADPALMMARYLARYRKILQHQNKLGARFLFGSDTAVGTPGWGNPPGLSGFREMQAWHAAGIDLGRILRAATLSNAEAFGIAAQVGSIEVGKRADLLVLRADPLLTLQAYDAIDAIVLNGDVIDRAALSARPLANSVRIEGARIVTAPFETASAPTDVVLEGGRITAIGALATARPVERVIDGSSQYLMPGLIDAHVHVGHVSGLGKAGTSQRERLLEAYFTQLPLSYLLFGFTSLLDPDLDAATEQRWRSAPVRPKLFGCGKGIRWPNSYGPALFPPDKRYAMFPNWVYDPAQAEQIPSQYHRDDFSAGAAVGRVVGRDGICIKTYYQPAWPGRKAWPLPGQDQLQAISDAAHRAGRPLMLHATSLEAYRMGQAVNADIFAHGLWKQESPFGPIELKAGMALMVTLAHAGKVVMPTLRVLQGELSPERDILRDQRMIQVLPQEILAFWGTAPENRPGDQLTEPEELAMVAAMADNAAALVRTFAQAGGQVAFGSDTPSSDGISNPPGLNGRLELDALAKAGLAPSTILKAATIDAARAFGLQGEIGSIALGKAGDLLLLKANPLEGMAAFDQITWVFIDGKPVARRELDATQQIPDQKQ